MAFVGCTGSGDDVCEAVSLRSQSPGWHLRTIGSAPAFIGGSAEASGLHGRRAIECGRHHPGILVAAVKDRAPFQPPSWSATPVCVAVQAVSGTRPRAGSAV